MRPDYCLFEALPEGGCRQCSLSSYGMDCRMNKIKEEEKKQFEIFVPGRDLYVFEADSYEEAVDRFEEALWAAGLLDDDDFLNATDLGIAVGGLGDELERQGFLRYDGAYIAEA